MVNHLLEAREAKIQAIRVLNRGFLLHNIVFRLAFSTTLPCVCLTQALGVGFPNVILKCWRSYLVEAID